MTKRSFAGAQDDRKDPSLTLRMTKRSFAGAQDDKK